MMHAFGPGGKKPLGCFCSERGWPHTFGCGYTGLPAAFSPVTSSPAFGSEPMMPSVKRRKYVACFCSGVFACFHVHCFCILMRASFGQDVEASSRRGHSSVLRSSCRRACVTTSESMRPASFRAKATERLLPTRPKCMHHIACTRATPKPL